MRVAIFKAPRAPSLGTERLECQAALSSWAPTKLKAKPPAQPPCHSYHRLPRCPGNYSPTPVWYCKQAPLWPVGITNEGREGQRAKEERCLSMYLHSRLRRRDIITDIADTLLGMSLDPRLMPAPAAAAVDPEVQRSVRSSASTPSLRSRDGTVPPHAMKDPGGNVRVVVRVRAFLPRGKHPQPTCCQRQTPWSKKKGRGRD